MKQKGTSLENMLELLKEAVKIYPDYVNLSRAQSRAAAVVEIERATRLIRAEEAGLILSLNRYRNQQSA